MPKRKKPSETKRPIDLTDDEAMEWMFGKETRDKLKETAREARKPDTYEEKSPHK